MNISELAFAIRYLREIYNLKIVLYMTLFKTGGAEELKYGCIFCHNKLCPIYKAPRTDLCNAFYWNHFNTDKERWDDNFVNSEGEFWCPVLEKVVNDH